MSETGGQTRGGASAAAIQAHYDVGNSFFRLWLDPTLTYSCALWAGEGDTLEAAQQRKLTWIAEPALARGAKRLLDVGSGWGGLLAYAQAHGVERGVGLTLSREQHDHVAAMGIPGVEVRLESWRDHQPAAPYDAIVSVGAFEHFADQNLNEAERLGVYRDFFAACHRWLPEGAPLVLQTIAYGPVATHLARERFLEIFPESDLPRPFEIFKATDGLFEITDYRNDREHYVRTLRDWHRRLRARTAEATAEVGRERVDFYKRYLALSVLMFEGRYAVLLRLRMTRV
ncbi:MAG TPA: cyclopropane-fatty-acyl-phospholipid synthase family protein [Caulobacteraceae bacterium]|nr:cyclopropane-fatty-acyl-phospholipid synthase family protein [Caulobacteraceae bacterium]